MISVTVPVPRVCWLCALLVSMTLLTLCNNSHSRSVVTHETKIFIQTVVLLRMHVCITGRLLRESNSEILRDDAVEDIW